MDRLHPARPGRAPHRHHQARRHRRAMLTTGPGDEGPSWAASSREILFQRVGPSGRTGLYRVCARRQPAASDHHSAGRIGPRLVRSDGLMRKSLLFAALALAPAPPQPNCRSCPARSAAAARSRSQGSTRCAPTSPPNPAARQSISAPRPSGSTRRREPCSPRRRPGCGATRSRGAGRGLWRFRRHARSCAGGRRAPGRGSARAIWCCWASPPRSCRPPAGARNGRASAAR